MTTRAVFDTSALAPALIPHDLTEASRLALSRYEPVFLNLVRIELANVLRTQVRGGRIEPAEALFTLLAFTSKSQFVPTEDLLQTALELAIDHDHGVYDCLYLAAANTMDLPLMTADNKLFRKFEAKFRGRLGNLNLPSETWP